MKHAHYLPLVLLLTLVACGDGPAEPVPDPVVTGSWRGPLDAQTTVSLLLNEIEGAVTGSGTFQITGAEGIPFHVVSGTHVYPNLSLVLDGDGYQAFNYTATVEQTFITGTLQGSGFTGETLILTRQ